MHAVVFSGGGAKGIYQAYEFIKQLEEGAPPPDLVYGSSVGAINAAGYAFRGLGLLNLWKAIRGRSDVIRLNWRFWNAAGVFRTEPLKRMLEKHIRGIPLCRAVVCSVDLVTRNLDYVYSDQVPVDEFREAVRASAAIPFAMCPVGTRVDGGVREATPLLRAILDGADSITVYLCNPFQEDSPRSIWEMPRGPLKSLMIGLRSIDIMQHEILRNDIETCLFYNRIPKKKKIDLRVYSPRPQDCFIDTLDFEPSKIRQVIQRDIRMEDCLAQAEQIAEGKVA